MGEYKTLVAHEVPPTGQATVYRTGDDGTFQAGFPGTTRFRDNGDGTILDFSTGLMWVQDPIANPGAPLDASIGWNAAIDACLALDFAGHDDWRLPNRKELYSIADLSRTNPAIDVTVFPNTEVGLEWYWSSTTDITATTDAWGYLALQGGCIRTAKANDGWVRPVRGGVLNG